MQPLIKATRPFMHPLWPRVETYLPQLWRTVRAYEVNAAVQDELMQEVLMAIWQSLKQLRDAERLLPFVLGIAHNLGSSHVRTEMKMPRRVSLDDAPLEIAAASIDESSGEDGRWLLDAVRQLPLPLRQVLLLRLEGFEYKEIAGMLGISVDNVGVRAHRARKLLQEINNGN
jgi:RNA polymerase sigma factor (sigma-70 family)